MFTLSGDLGAGKTTFVKAFCKVIGIPDEVSSPTFAIVNEYRNSNKVYHFDLYRIERQEELYEIGFEEYLDDDAYIFIEWPELAMPFIDSPYLDLKFETAEKNQRNIFYRYIN